jgi:hypothetical protein
MVSKFLRFALGALVLLTPTGLLAQESATMSAPVVRTAEGQVIFTTNVENFVAGSNYRIGVGGVGNSGPAASIELELGDSALAKPATDFTQGYTSHWWGMEALKSRGVALAPGDLPAAGERLTVRVKIPKESANGFDKLYIFVSRDYGGDTWYLEDGVELDKSYW